MCSTAGSEKPSYNEGITATSAEASTRAYSASGRPLANVTRSPRASCRSCCLVASDGVPMTTRCASRSVASLATARSSVGSPFSGESALVTVTIRPGTRGWSGRGRNSRVSTPSGTMCTISRLTRKSRHMSSLEEEDTVTSGPARRATRPCIRTNPYQRRLFSWPNRLRPARSSRRSTEIGWWIEVTSGRPSRRRPSIP